MSVSTYQDVQTAIGRPISDQQERARVEWWLDSAEIQIKARLGDLSKLDQDVLRYVVVEAVVARLSNPEGYASEGIDDYTYRLPAESRKVTILPEWWAMLSPQRGSFYTIGLSSPLDLP